MKKTVVFIILIFVFLSAFTFSAYAESDTKSDELYQNQYNASGAEKLEEMLPKDTRDIIESFGIDPKNPQSFENFGSENFFSIIWETITQNFGEPFSAVMAIIGVLLIFAAIDGLMTDFGSNDISTFVCFMATIFLLKPVYLLISGVEAVIRGMSGFMATFVPVYAGIIASGGSVSTAGGYSALLLAVAEGISQFLSFVFLPIVSGTMSLGVMGSISPITAAMRFAEWIKKSAVWIMGIITTVFLSVLSIQTTITAAADNVGIRTSKAVISGTIPIMGPAIAETLNTARGCLSLLRSGVGIYGAVAVALLALPFLLKILMWRLGMWVCSGVADIFVMPKISNLFKAVDFCLSILLGAVCFIAILFVISMTVVLKVGG